MLIATHGAILSQRKYALDLLEEIGLFGCKPASTPMDTDLDFRFKDGELFEDTAQYRRLVSKLIYLTVTRSDIAFAVELVSQFMHKPKEVH